MRKPRRAQAQNTRLIVMDFLIGPSSIGWHSWRAGPVTFVSLEPPSSFDHSSVRHLLSPCSISQ
ncbi:hypothetical protein HETIRDRAFT_327953 [Heterobasidion irregulare TC 32-1]|uniref:Uncharacterized protein n=1 Tax=Heterobasidion irregulare (strain TC 32-1) TaxID=747525 RepID=W4JT68_HETIT|nr:uncharacterized protein HETIRDRAFT_327953 [Heterobasidion irregulare TC 32-1]ETW76757.1 hypothetical protein HETIRDRAFT_327953 [Heterobasidion irregulare TC 32-1]